MTKKPVLILIGVIGFLALVGGALWYTTYPKSIDSRACTSEAKICPDGSAVGRSGPQCTFAPCPNGDTLFEKVGIITTDTQNKQEIHLVYEEPGKPALTKILSFDSASMCSSPEATQLCDVFNAPLGVVFQGKRVRVTGVDQGAQLRVVRLETQAEDPTPARITVQTKINQPVSGLGVTITPLEVVTDSRCPTDVQCIWAGTIQIRATITSSTTTEQVTFERGMVVSTKDSFITLTQVTPEKNSKETLSPSDYRFTFEITSRK